MPVEKQQVLVFFKKKKKKRKKKKRKRKGYISKVTSRPNFLGKISEIRGSPDQKTVETGTSLNGSNQGRTILVQLFHQHPCTSEFLGQLNFV
jgi:hypothetical protein